MKIFFIPFLIVTALLFIQCRKKEADKSAKKTPAMVDVMIAAQLDLSSTLEVNGTVLAHEMVELRPEISGRIIFLNMPDGATVQEGPLLARINDAELQAQLEQQKSQLDLARKTEKRLGDLLRVNGVNQADYDAALNQVNVLDANIKVTQAQIDKTCVRAPFTGKLGLREVSPGTYVTPQTMLGTLQATERLKVDFTVPETSASLVRPGNKVRLKLNGSEQILQASITAVEAEVNSATRNIKARAVITNNSLIPGSFVKVMLDKEHLAIVVPTNAIIPDALSNQVVVVKDGKANFIPVETGFRNSNSVEIVSGLSEGDSVIVSGMLYVRPNAAVKVRKVVKQ
jgi:membrane fusion protein (multidrug efflux system)